MPLKHTRLFRIRQYECDANGHVNNANFLRYMQETALDASAAAGYDHNRYYEIGHIWLIHESEIEFKIPLIYGDTLKIITWVEDFRRVSSRRVYEFYKEPSGNLIAKANTDWIFINDQNRRPTKIPQEMIDAFYPEGEAKSFPIRQTFPIPPPEPSGVFTSHFKVNWQDIDAVGHVNNAIYLDYMNECSMQMLRAHGWPWIRMKEHGFAIFIRQIRIKYIQPALLDDELSMATWAYNIRRSTSERYFVIRRLMDNELIAEINILGVWVNINNGKPIRIPNKFLENFKPNIADY